MLLIYIYLKLLSGFTVDTIGATHRGIGLIWFISTTSRGFLSILTVDFPSLLRSSVNLTFGRKRCSESVVASLPHLLLPCFYCPAYQVPWKDRKPYNKKDTPSGVPLSNQRLPILPGRLQPSTFGVYELNYCVRDGNRWILIAIATESVRVCTLKTT